MSCDRGAVNHDRRAGAGKLRGRGRNPRVSTFLPAARCAHRRRFSPSAASTAVSSRKKRTVGIGGSARSGRTAFPHQGPASQLRTPTQLRSLSYTQPPDPMLGIASRPGRYGVV